jgi:hypothetical protein
VTQYTQNTTFATKTDADTIIGEEFDAEFSEIQTAVNSKADIASPTFTGTVTGNNITATGTLNASGTFQINSVAVTATAAELNILDGVTATAAELNYMDGVTSNVQTQLDLKAPIASPTFTGTVTLPATQVTEDFAVDTSNDTFFVDVSTQRVGIGTNSPAEELDVHGSTILRPDTDPALTITNSFNAGVSEITNLAGATYISTDTDGELGTAAFTAFRVSNLDVKMIIRGDGNVGIGGVPVASSTYRTLNITGGSDSGGALRLSTTESESAHLFNFNSGAYLSGDGTVFISTGDPDSGSGIPLRTAYRIDRATALHRWYDPSDGTTERMRIDSSGRLILASVPTSDPSIAGAIWSDSGTLKISAG